LATTATYHVRAYIKTQSGAVYYGENRTFTTTQVVSLPEVAVTTVSAIRTDRVTFQSSVTSDGNSAITDYGFVYATWQNPTVDAAEKLSAGAGNASFGKTALELAEGTTYYVRAYATNAMGTAYGDETSFSTLAVTAPTLAAVSVSGVGISDATLTGSVTDNGNAAITEAGFCWSENPYPTTSDNKISCGTGTALSAGLSNLNDGITYYVRAYAINSKGTGYSADATFTTITLPTNVIFVSSQGNDSNDGRSWSKAKKTIGAAMTAANVGEQVWVTNATFQESVTLKEGVDLYGGFAGTEISILQKSSSGKTTLLGGRIVQSNNFSTPVNVDGFTISTVSTNIVFNGGIVLNNFVINNCNATISIMNCTMSNSTITNNSNAIKLSNCTIENSTISNNANYAISLVSTTISNSILSNNVYISSGENSELNTCIISNNSSYGLFFTTGNLINCKIQNNKGFGILLAGEGNLVGCLITGNGALSRSQNGNGFYAYGVRIQASSNERVNIYNCTINNNITQSNSCGNYCSNHQEVDIVSAGTVYIVNSIIYPNVPRSGGSHISVTGTANNFYVSNTLSANEFTMGQGNIRITNKADYKLDANSYAPQSDSPAINAGDNSFVETTKDVNGNTRIQGGTVDIGAVESSY
jgi:hypothetical protein